MLRASLKWMGVAFAVAILVVGTGCSSRHKGGLDKPGGDEYTQPGMGTGESGISGDITNLNIPPADRDMIPEGQPQPNSALQTVYFDYNQYNLKPEAVATLERNLEWILANPGRFVRIEGNCDERGTEPYNQALGEKRAEAIRNYLVTRGADPNRLVTISFGESNPVVMGTGESAWRQNRRGEFKSW